MPNITHAGVFYEEGHEPPGYVRPAETEAEPELPPKSAPKADWVEHAVQVTGLDPDEAQAMTKPELVKAVIPPLPLGSEAPGG
jgi:hypothetical protein